MKASQGTLWLSRRPDPTTSSKDKQDKWCKDSEDVLDDPRADSRVFGTFTKSVFVEADSNTGYQLWPKPYRVDLAFRDQVGVGEECFVWATSELFYEYNDKTYWSSDNWYQRWKKWGAYVYDCRSGNNGKDKEKYLQVEKEATQVGRTQGDTVTEGVYTNTT